MNRNLEFFKIKLILALKCIKEYKTNFWSLIVLDFTFFLVFMLLYSVIGDLIFETLKWETKDFHFLFIAMLLASKLKFMLSTWTLGYLIIYGKFNNYLSKPINPFFFASLEKLTGEGIVTVLILFPIFLLFAFVNYGLISLILSLLVLILGTIFYICCINFFISFCFYFKKGNFILNIVESTNYTIEKFTPKVFEKSSFKNFFFLIPASLYSYFVVQIARGTFEEFLYYLPYFIVLMLFFNFVTLINWKIGLRRYEAFN